jgi:hypothetical protein
MTKGNRKQSAAPNDQQGQPQATTFRSLNMAMTACMKTVLLEPTSLSGGDSLLLATTGIAAATVVMRRIFSLGTQAGM